MENYLYKCQYCGTDYKPNRRKKQKYCSNSCRTRAFQIRNPQLGLTIPTEEKKPEALKIDRMSFAGVGNAAVGTFAVNTLTRLLTIEENKPATKKDLQNLLKNLNNRYHPILNIPMRHDGAKPYYDLDTKTIIYKLNLM